MIYTSPVYITDARRTPIGRLGGGLRSLSATDLALPVAQAMVPEALKPAIQQVILGQVLPAGSGMNVARQLGLKLGLPQSTPAYGVNMVCGSGMKAVALGADAIASGEASLVLAGGVESMSRAPHYATDLRQGCKLGNSTLADAILTDGLTDPVLNIGMGETAERIVDACVISREDQDAFALRSQQLAAANRDAFQREIVPLTTREGTVQHDEHPRADTTLEKLASLKPAFRKDGSVTAGNSSGVNDGAALLLLASSEAIRQHGLTARARIVACTAVGCDPATMGLGPVHAIRRLCEETGWDLAEVDAFEINEAFAAQALACARQLHLDPAKLNRRGGAIALGHPVGCSGARVLVTLLHLMEDLQLPRGIASLCIGGGMGIAMAIEWEG
ncbi:thiolase family protein [Prosthecobacter dejongeii]|uniref:Acetyl-CoA C-acetyltransferase n=1 Tax=Prosthecobacter dejongeii TaxID=48465 RepID=A0A7W7YGI2_9BACT|nr:thiolase family protein [Prosthecobacter dejongeii]MBB5035783.1 acetyl-CoA C-acetyltransferase [Prosthecobacter dejongeii]